MKTYSSRLESLSALVNSQNHFTFGNVTLLKFALLVRRDVMLCAQAFNMASKMADVQVVLVRRFLLLQSG